MHTGNFKVVKIISFGVHRPRPNAWRAGVTMLISINLFATANLPQARPVADSIDTCLRATCLPRCGAGTAHRQAVNALP